MTELDGLVPEGAIPVVHRSIDGNEYLAGYWTSEGKCPLNLTCFKGCMWWEDRCRYEEWKDDKEKMDKKLDDINAYWGL